MPPAPPDAPPAAKTPRTLVVVVPAFDEAHRAGEVLDGLAALRGPLAELGLTPRLVVVDDGSRDGTAEAFRSLAAGRPFPVRIVRFQRNFGKDAAMLAGLTHGEGDLYVLVDADGQTPFAKIPEMARTLLADRTEVVYAVKESEPYGPARRALTNLFFFLARKLGIKELRKGSSDFMLFSRRVRDRLLSLPEQEVVVRNLVRWLGEPCSTLTFAPPRAEGSRWSTRQLFWLAMKSILSFSHVLRINFFVALAYWIFSVVYGSVILYNKITGRIVVGLSTMTLLTLLSFGLLFLMIAIIGEYLIALFEEVKRRPRFLVETVEDLPAPEV